MSEVLLCAPVVGHTGQELSTLNMWVLIPDSNDSTSDGEGAVVAPCEADNLTNVEYLSQRVVNGVIERGSTAVIACQFTSCLQKV